MKRMDKWKLLAAATLVGATAVGLLASGQTNQEADIALQAAIHKEKVDGELEQAIQQYKTIVSKYKANRTVAAQALLHMGQCYERLGAGEAQTTYEQLIKEYSDQADVISIARERLANIRRVARSTGTELAVRKVWADSSTDVEGEISPDGRYLSFVDWETGDLGVRDLRTGKNRRLTNKGTWKESDDFALYSRWSPDGRQLAYDWYVDHSGQTPVYSVELRIADAANSNYRAIHTVHGHEGWLETADWSPDGKRIAVVRTVERGKNEIALVSVADGSVEVVKTFDTQWPWPVMFSPDGRFLLYSFRAREGAEERDLFLISLDGHQVSTLIDHPADDSAMGWSPDGKWALFLSDRTGTLDLWAIRVAAGKAQGAAHLIKPVLGRAWPIGVTRDSAFYYGMTQYAFDVYAATFDPATGKTLTPATKLVKRFEGINDWPWYSPDGKRLAYVSARQSGARIHYNVLCIRSLETGEEKEFPTSFRRLAGTRWTPDGRSVFVATWGYEDRMSICRVDVRTGEFTPVVQTEKG